MASVVLGRDVGSLVVRASASLVVRATEVGRDAVVGSGAEVGREVGSEVGIEVPR